MAFTKIGQNLMKLSFSNVQYSGRRLYARWAHRQPSRVLSQPLPTAGSFLKQEKIIELDAEVLQNSRERHAEKAKSNAKPKVKPASQVVSKRDSPTPERPEKVVHIDVEKIKIKREKIINTTKNLIKDQAVFDEQGDIIYEKLKDNDGRISGLLVKLKSKKNRGRSSQILVEGWRLICDGIKSKCFLRYIIFSRVTDLEHLKPYLPPKGVKICKIPYKEIEMWSDVDTPAGIFGIFETPTPENIRRESKPLPLNLICDNIRTPGNLGAILRAAVGVGFESVYLTKGCVDMWDPKVVRSASGAHFRLPIHSSLEWDQIAKLTHSDTSVFVADHHSKIQMNHKVNQECHESEREDTESDVDRVDNLNVPVVPYYGVDYSALKSITLIIGGETEGISEDSYRFVASRNGLRVNIPLQKGVDSLNTGMATAVIAFEMKKQILEAKAKYRESITAS